MANKLQEFMDVLAKAMVKNPGKRGGKFVRTKSGGVKYLSARRAANKATDLADRASLRMPHSAKDHLAAQSLHLKAGRAHYEAMEATPHSGNQEYHHRMMMAHQKDRLHHGREAERIGYPHTKKPYPRGSTNG